MKSLLIALSLTASFAAAATDMLCTGDHGGQEIRYAVSFEGARANSMVVTLGGVELGRYAGETIEGYMYGVPGSMEVMVLGASATDEEEMVAFARLQDGDEDRAVGTFYKGDHAIEASLTCAP